MEEERTKVTGEAAQDTFDEGNSNNDDSRDTCCTR